MPVKNPTREKNGRGRLDRQRRWQRIIFSILAVIIILTWIITLVVKV
jgi:hypothetical protein